MQIEGAGPALPKEVDIAPIVFRTMADWVLENCLNKRTGSPGGWFTTDLTHLREYVTGDGVDLNDPYRKAFLYLYLPKSPFLPNQKSPKS